MAFQQALTNDVLRILRRLADREGVSMAQAKANSSLVKEAQAEFTKQNVGKSAASRLASKEGVEEIIDQPLSSAPESWKYEKSKGGLQGRIQEAPEPRTPADEMASPRRESWSEDLEPSAPGQDSLYDRVNRNREADTVTPPYSENKTEMAAKQAIEEADYRKKMQSSNQGGNVAESQSARSASNYNENADYPKYNESRELGRNQMDDASSGFESSLDMDPILKKSTRRAAAAATGLVGAGATGTWLASRGASGNWGNNAEAGTPATGRQEEPAQPAAGSDKSEAQGGVRNMADENKSVNRESQPSKAAFYNKMNQMRSELERLNAGGYDTSKLDAEVDAARELYQSEKKRNEALGLAQLIAQSVARMGAAIEGNKKGRYIGDINSPSVDYEARTGNAREEYRTSLADVSARRREGREAYESDRRSLQERTMAPLKMEAEFEAKAYEDRVREVQNSAREKKQDEKSLQDRVKQNQAMYNTLMNKTIDETKLTQKEQANALSFINMYASDSDKMKQLAEKNAGPAGVTPQLIDEAQKYADENNKWNDGKDDSDFVSEYLSNNLLTPIQQKLTDLQAKKSLYEQGFKTGKDLAELEAGSKKLTRQQLTDYATKYKMTEQDATAYLQKQGYTLE